jgi:hypothetical protein
MKILDKGEKKIKNILRIHIFLCLPESPVVDPHLFDPDPSFHFDANPVQAFHFVADQDPVFHFDSVPYPASQLKANFLLIIVTKYVIVAGTSILWDN